MLVGGVWAFLALGFLKDFTEVRPAFKCGGPPPRRALAASPPHASLTSTPYSLWPRELRVWRHRPTHTEQPSALCVVRPCARRSPDNLMAMAEEKYKRRCRVLGKPYQGKLKARKGPPSPAFLICFHRQPPQPLEPQRQGAPRAAAATSARPARPSQSPFPADNAPQNQDKTPRIVKWKMDR